MTRQDAIERAETRAYVSMNRGKEGEDMKRLTQGTALFGDAEKQLYYKRLAAYEDTGLTPEEIMDGKMRTEWIPVTERMPDDGEEVLVTDRFGERRIAYHSREGWHLALTGSIYVHGPKVWMPLPEPFNLQN